MDIDEAVRRLRANLFLIISCLVIGLGVPATLHQNSGRSYRASARLVLDAPDPKNQGAATAIADTARALVTSLGAVTEALAKAGVDRDPGPFGVGNVRIKPVGTSAILELSVLDSDPVAAAKIANALAQGLVDKRRDLAHGRFRPLIDDLAGRIKTAATVAANLEAAYQRTGGAVALERYRNAIRIKEDLEAEKRKVEAELASQPQAEIVDRATPPTKARATGLRADLLLGGFLGLFMGIGLAGVRETLHPTVVGGRSISRLLDVPFVGTLTARLGARNDPAMPALASRVRLAAEAAGVWTIALTSAGGATGLGTFAEQLQSAVDADDRSLHLISSREPRGTLQIVSVEGDGLRALRDAPSTVGLMLVSPTVIKRRELDGVVDLRSMTGWQLLGVVTYPWRAFGRRRRQRQFRRTHPITTAGDILPSYEHATLDITDPSLEGEKARGRWK